jgi:hypothetical protein
MDIAEAGFAVAQAKTNVRAGPKIFFRAGKCIANLL